MHSDGATSKKYPATSLLRKLQLCERIIYYALHVRACLDTWMNLFGRWPLATCLNDHFEFYSHIFSCVLVCVRVCVCLELYKRCLAVDSFLSVAAAASHGTGHDRISYEFHQPLSNISTHDSDKMHIQIILLCEY